jgi:cell division protein FtsN
MTRDYAKPSTTKKPAAKRKKKPAAKTISSSKKAPAAKVSDGGGSNKALHLFLIAALLGGFGFALYKLSQVDDGTTNEQISKPAPQTSKPAAKATPQEQVIKKPEARFQFYDLLPNSEVETDTVDAYTFKEKGAEEEYLYMVQTGSFRSSVDAERQKATIAFQGLKAKVRTVTNDKGSTWHRVETGPFQSRSEMNAALDKLYAINIQPLVKKSKKQ